MNGSLSSKGTMMIVASFATGSLLGEWLNLEKRFEGFGEWLKAKTGKEAADRQYAPFHFYGGVPGFLAHLLNCLIRPVSALHLSGQNFRKLLREPLVGWHFHLIFPGKPKHFIYQSVCL